MSLPPRRHLEFPRRLRDGFITTLVLILILSIRPAVEAIAHSTQQSDLVTAQAVFSEAERLHAKGDLESLEKAIEKYQKALLLFRSSANRAGEANALSKLGEIRLYTGEMRAALDDWSQELLLRHAAGDRGREAHVLLNIGTAYNDLGLKQKALDSFNQALVIYKSVGNRIEDPNLLINIGWVYYSLFEMRKAIKLFSQAHSLSRSVGNREAQARALVGMGGVYTQSQKQKALDFYKQALSINRAIGARREEAYTLHSLGWLYLELGNKQEAIDRNHDALSIMREIGERKGEAMVLHGIGWIYDRWGKKLEAIGHYRQALEIRRELTDYIGQADTLFRLAQCERKVGQLAEARDDIDSVIKILESLRTTMGDQELRVNYIDYAHRYYEFYLEVLWQMHQRNPSHGYDAGALQISERARARSLLELLNEARADIRQGVDAELLKREQDLQQHITVTTAKRLRLLNIKHTVGQANEATRQLEALASELQEVKAKIRSTSPRYASLTQPQTLTLKEIQQLLDPDTLLLEFALGEEHCFLWSVTPTSINSFELGKASTVKAAAKRVYELLTAQTIKLPRETSAQREARIAKSDAEYRTAALSLSRMLLGPVAEQLGRKRLVIVSDGPLQYIPFAVLPVPANRHDLQRQDAKVVGSADSPLVLHHEIVNLPSASTLSLLRRDLEGRKSPTKSVAVFADPVFESTDQRVSDGSSSKPNSSRRPRTNKPHMARDASDLNGTLKALRDHLIRIRTMKEGQPLARLPYTRKEALSIASFVPESQRKILLDFDVNYQTATSSELSDYRFVHFATHGLLDTESPELSGILLSLVDRDGKPQENGILRLGDIYNLKLPVDLVSLSACETALGKSIRGEGLVGLTRGFMYAGAPRVMASLWKVEEAATAELMKAFYAGLLGPQQLRPAAALRQAQIEMWRSPNRSAPYYWGAFVMQGEWR